LILLGNPKWGPIWWLAYYIPRLSRASLCVSWAFLLVKVSPQNGSCQKLSCVYIILLKLCRENRGLFFRTRCILPCPCVLAILVYWSRSRSPDWLFASSQACRGLLFSLQCNPQVEFRDEPYLA